MYFEFKNYLSMTFFLLFLVYFQYFWSESKRSHLETTEKPLNASISKHQWGLSGDCTWSNLSPLRNHRNTGLIRNTALPSIYAGILGSELSNSGQALDLVKSQNKLQNIVKNKTFFKLTVFVRSSVLLLKTKTLSRRRWADAAGAPGKN